MKVTPKSTAALDVKRTGVSIIKTSVPKDGGEEGETVLVTQMSVQFKVGGESLSDCVTLTEQEEAAVNAIADRIMRGKMAQNFDEVA